MASRLDSACQLAEPHQRAAGLDELEDMLTYDTCAALLLERPTRCWQP